MTRWQFFLAQLKETALWGDQGGNVLAGWVSFIWSLLTLGAPPQVHSADETVSAHLYRRSKQGKLWGKVFMPVVDVVFALWQRDDKGNVVWDHCHQAYLKEKSRVYLPPEYHKD